MTDFYQELGLDKSKNSESINVDLRRLETAWKRREISNPEKAGWMLDLISQAKEVFISDASKREYDASLEGSHNLQKHIDPEKEKTAAVNKWKDEAWSYYGSGQYDLAKVAVDKAFTYMSTSKEDDGLLWVAADVYRANGDLNKAMDFINRAIVLAPDTVDYYISKGIIYEYQSIQSEQRKAYVNVRNFQAEARKTLQLAYEKAELSGDPMVKARACGALAVSYYFHEPIDKKKAEELANQADLYGGDSNGNAEKVLTAINEEREVVYIEAGKLMQSDDPETLKKAIETYNTIRDYKDSAACIKKTEARILAIVEKKRKEKEAGRKRIVIIAGIAVVAIIAVFIIGQIKGIKDEGSNENGDGSSEYYSEESATEGAIPEDAGIFNGHHYQVVNSPMYWDEAKAACEDMGGHLATITSQEEQDYIAGLIEEHGDKMNYWIGGTDEDQEGTWTWITGEEWNYTNWRDKQPDNRSEEGDDEGQNYLQIGCGSDDQDRYMKWWDMSNSGISENFKDAPNYKDTQYFGFVCEWE